MGSTGRTVPLLQFQLPQSPLLSGCLNLGTTLSDDFFATLAAQGISSPLPTFSFSSQKVPRTSATCSPRFRHSPVSDVSREKALPPVPPIPPKQIISLLNLLDRMDDDTAKDVQRVRESIKEARSSVAQAREELAMEEDQLSERRAKEKRETKGVDDDFWLNA